MSCPRPFPPDAILHLAIPADWDDATEQGVYTRSWRHGSLTDAGFIHCSFPHQIERTANLFYSDLTELLMLHVDPGRCDGPVVIEAGGGDASELFPHLYGAIPVGAVHEVRTWTPRSDGTYVLGDADV